jgi:hypothetical protein
LYAEKVLSFGEQVANLVPMLSNFCHLTITFLFEVNLFGIYFYK